MARTAVVAGTATAVSNRVSRRQANRWSAKEQSQYAQPQYAQPQYAQPQYAQPPYAQPQYAQPQYAQPQYAQPQYAPPAPVAAPDPVAQLTQLAELKNQGILTDAEFQAQKAKILAM
jgi:hypothetical protein